MLNAPIREALKEVRGSIISVLLAGVLINAIIIFLVSYLCIVLFGFPGWPALIPAAVYLLLAALGRLRTNTVRLVESKYSHLNEKLRTAADNLNANNPLVQELHMEIFSDLKAVELSSFLNERKVWAKAILISVLCLLLLFSPAVSHQFQLRLPAPLVKLIPQRPAFITPPSGDVPEAYAGGPQGFGNIKGTDDIYGSTSVAQMGSEEIKVIIPPKNYDINVRDIRDAPMSSFTGKGIAPEEVFAASAPADDANIPLEQQEIVKRYFKALAGG